MNIMEKQDDDIRACILAGDKSLLKCALKREFPIMTAVVATAAAVLYGFTDEDIVALIKEGTSVTTNVIVPFDLYVPFGCFSIAALDLLGIEKYKGDDSLVRYVIGMLPTYFKRQSKD